jgi:hypothetical protein
LLDYLWCWPNASVLGHDDRRCTHSPAPAQHALSSENGRDYQSLAPEAAHRATASHSQATRHPQTRRGHRIVLLFRDRERPTAVHACLAATHQRAISPFFHVRSGSQRPHASPMHHTPAAGISGFSSTRGLGLTGAEPPRHGTGAEKGSAADMKPTILMDQSNPLGLGSRIREPK